MVKLTDEGDRARPGFSATVQTVLFLGWPFKVAPSLPLLSPLSGSSRLFKIMHSKDLHGSIKGDVTSCASFCDASVSYYRATANVNAKARARYPRSEEFRLFVANADVPGTIAARSIDGERYLNNRNTLSRFVEIRRKDVTGGTTINCLGTDLECRPWHSLACLVYYANYYPALRDETRQCPYARTSRNNRKRR